MAKNLLLRKPLFLMAAIFTGLTIEPIPDADENYLDPKKIPVEQQWEHWKNFDLSPFPILWPREEPTYISRST